MPKLDVIYLFETGFLPGIVGRHPLEESHLRKSRAPIPHHLVHRRIIAQRQGHDKFAPGASSSFNRAIARASLSGSRGCSSHPTCSSVEIVTMASYFLPG